MDKIFSSKYIRTKFLYTVIITIILFYIIRYLILPSIDIPKSLSDFLCSAIDKFNASLITAVIVGYFLYLMQIEEKKRELEFTDAGDEIEKYLSRGRQATETWRFTGGLGRYTKQTTIPQLSKIASENRRTISVELIMINPFNQNLLDKYIAFRISVEKEKNKQYWTPEIVQTEILATIITAFYYRKLNQFLNISVYIKDFFTLSRMDISSDFAVITREDPKIPSVVAKKGAYLFQHYSEEFQQVLRQSKKLEYLFPNSISPSRSEIEICTKALFPNEFLSKEILDLVYDKFQNPKNPFE